MLGNVSVARCHLPQAAPGRADRLGGGGSRRDRQRGGTPWDHRPQREPVRSRRLLDPRPEVASAARA